MWDGKNDASLPPSIHIARQNVEVAPLPNPRPKDDRPQPKPLRPRRRGSHLSAGQRPTTDNQPKIPHSKKNRVFKEETGCWWMLVVEFPNPWEQYATVKLEIIIFLRDRIGVKIKNVRVATTQETWMMKLIHRCGVFWKKNNPRHHPRAHAGTWVRNPRLLLQIAWPASHGWKWCGSSLRQRWKYGDTRWSAHPTYVGKTFIKKKQPHLQHLFDLPKNDQGCSDGAAYGWGKKGKNPRNSRNEIHPQSGDADEPRGGRKACPRSTRLQVAFSCPSPCWILVTINNSTQVNQGPRTCLVFLYHWRTRSTSKGFVIVEILSNLGHFVYLVVRILGTSHRRNMACAWILPFT